MRKIWKRSFTVLASFVLAVFTAVVGVFPAAVSVRADSVNSVTAYESRNVLEDLENATINGEAFSLKKYGFNGKKETQVLTLAEYCYAFYPEKQDDYGLYVYVYNPKGLYFDTDSSLNQIQLAYVDGMSTHYAKYQLRFLNYSTETNYERLFYKFKVILTNERRAEILSTVNSTERVYRVSGIELLTKGQTNATDYTVATTYKYSGYAAGYGSDEHAKSTVQVCVEQAETLSLGVRSTVYRPEGVNGKNDYTQDSLHSVYFAVPNDVISRYGEMTAIHATWLNAVLKPALVTGNSGAYEKINEFLGADMREYNADLGYMYLGAYSVGGGINGTVHHHGYSYNATSWTGNTLNRAFYGELIDRLYLNFYAGGGTDSADAFTLSRDALLQALRASRTKFGGTLVNGKYSKVVFESVDSAFTEVNIRADENYSLTSEVVSGNFWKWLFGGDGYTATTFDGIRAIYPVQASDISGTNAEIAKRLYISESDCEEFKKFYTTNKNLATVYLFRYQTSEYIAQEAALLQKTKNLFGTELWEKVDTNAYFFQETVNLDFDIIDVTFSNGETETILPVVSDPIDVLPEATPPVHTTSDEEPTWLKRLKKALAVIFLCVLVFALLPILPTILDILALPFKAIGKWLGGGNKKE